MTVARILKNRVSAVITASPSDSLRSVAAKLARHDIGCVAVVGADGAVSGMVYERQLLRAIAEDPAAAETRTAREVMSPPRCCSADSTETELLQAMAVDGIPHMPVISEGKLAGIVSLGDVVRLRLEKVREMMAEIEREADSKRFTSYLRTPRETETSLQAVAG